MKREEHKTMWRPIRFVLLVALVTAIQLLVVGASASVWSAADRCSNWADLPMSYPARSSLTAGFSWTCNLAYVPFLVPDLNSIAIAILLVLLYDRFGRIPSLLGRIPRFLLRSLLPASVVYTFQALTFASGWWFVLDPPNPPVTMESIMQGLSVTERIFAGPMLKAIDAGWGFLFVVVYSMVWGIALATVVDLLIFGYRKGIARRRKSEPPDMPTSGGEEWGQ